MSSARALDKRLGDLEGKIASGHLDRERHHRRAEAAAEARLFLEEFDRGHHGNADPELMQLYREVDYFAWRNRWGGLDAEFVGRRDEPDGPISEVWQLVYESETLRLPEDHVRLAEINERLQELYAAADARVDAAINLLDQARGFEEGR